MRMKVSNYISEMLVKAGIHQAFMVTGGGAMHLDDALGHQEGLHCIYDPLQQRHMPGSIMRWQLSA